MAREICGCGRELEHGSCPQPDCGGRPIEHLPWRTGRRVGRTVYAVTGGADHDDLLIGLMDTRALAARAVADHNRGLDHNDTGLERYGPDPKES